MNDFESSIQLLQENKNYSCVVKKDDAVIISEKSGISPLLDLVDANIPQGYSAADRIVGKAAALLYVLLQINNVFGEVMSRSATEVFDKYGINYRYSQITDHIVNRTNTGECPMEITVKTISDPAEAYTELRKTVEKLRQINNKFNESFKL